MDIKSVLLWIFTIGVLTGLMFGALSLIGAVVYDFVNLRRQKRLNNRPYNKIYRYRPLLSVVVPAHNEELVIERCLTSLLKSSARKFEIIVSDDGSTDNTRALVRNFIKEHPNRDIKLVARRKNGGRGAAINSGVRRASGEIVMAIDADCLVHKRALRNAVKHFADSRTAAIAANIRVMETGNILSLIQQFDYLVSFRSKKFNTLGNCEYIIGGAGATYRRDLINQLKGFDQSMKTEDIEMSLRIARLLGNKAAHLKYASDVVIYTEPVPNYKSLFRQRFRWKFGSLQALYKHRQLLLSISSRHSRFLTLARLPFALWCEFMLLLEPFIFTYFLYQAIVYQNATLFVAAGSTVAVLLLIAIWSEEHLLLKSRLRLSSYAPLMYMAFYTLTIIQVLAAFKCLLNIKSLTGRKKVQGAYISPERIGGEPVPVS